MNALFERILAHVTLSSTAEILSVTSAVLRSEASPPFLPPSAEGNAGSCRFFKSKCISFNAFLTESCLFVEDRRAVCKSVVNLSVLHTADRTALPSKQKGVILLLRLL